MNTIDYRPFAPTLPPGRARALPWAMVLAGSALSAVMPVVADVPLVPPLGLLTLLTWRLLAPFALRRWAGAPLGLFDDLLSGQPLGSAVLLWSLAMLGVEMAEQRLGHRGFWLDWLVAALAIAGVLAAGRLLAAPLAATLAPVLWPQVLASVLLFPASARLVAWVDRKRGAEAAE
jgi:rod shape-determining protein MreD